ncbi:MAG: transposase [Acidobacteriia bacterium]|nr:transposase [Terriglobia bacterium]
MTFYRRHLPHWQPDGKYLFITWRLEGSLPREQTPAHISTGRAFAWFDGKLDEARSGPTWMKRQDIAQIVADSIRYAANELSYCELAAYVVMPNHVHMLALPMIAAGKLLDSIKAYSARQANLILGRTGEPFWAHESYDHWVRNRGEFERIRGYIERNPVRAGIVANPQDYPWSSAAP